MNATTPEADSLLARCPTLREMFATATAHDPDGKAVPLNSTIPPEFSEALYRTVKAQRPAVTVEVGMACGASSLAILTALRDLGSGRLLSIDPNQSADYQACGITAVRRAGLEAFHQLIEQPDFLALPDLLRAGTRVDFAYIDGWHTFDYTLLDFFYLDKMLPVGGVVGFNDVGMRAVHKVIKFLQTHRSYEEIDVGLRTVYWGRFAPLKVVAEPFLPRRHRRPCQDRYFRKTGAGEPAWNFFARF